MTHLNGRHLLVLAMSALFVPACAPPPEKVVEKPKRFSIAYDPHDERIVAVTLRDGKPMPDRDPVVLKEGEHIAHWVLVPPGSGELRIEMKDPKNNPFEEPFRQGTDHVLSWAPRKGSGGSGDEKFKLYAYKITVKADGKEYVLDPDLRVER